MCEHCRSGHMWEGDIGEDICEWVPEPLEDEDELPSMCLNPATRAWVERFVEDHLCQEHVDRENVALDGGLGNVYRATRRQESVDYLPIHGIQPACDVPVGNPLLGEPMTKCVNRATHARMVIEKTTYCAEHPD